jgi:hypothetical protein
LDLPPMAAVGDLDPELDAAAADGLVRAALGCCTLVGASFIRLCARLE